MRIHQSHIINLKHASKFLKEGAGFVVMKDETKIPISKNKKEDFLKWLDL
jgi:two-component system LytT family response regulator